MTLENVERLVIIAAVVSNLIQSWRTGRKVDEVHLATNSLTDRLVEETREGAHAKGVKEASDAFASAKRNYGE